jgi:hypothetical protein
MNERGRGRGIKIKIGFKKAILMLEKNQWDKSINVVQSKLL